MIAVRLPYVAPEAALACFADLPELTFLDSAAGGGVSYLCVDPEDRLVLEDDPYTRLRDWMGRQARAAIPADWPFAFAGGAVGWIGYDLARRAAWVESRFAAEMPGGWFGLYRTVLGFDVAGQRLYYLGISENLAGVAARLAAGAALPDVPALEWRAELGRAEYLERHERLREYIAAGDVYQANLTLRYAAPCPVGLDLAALYLALRGLSPAPFAGCVRAGEVGLACASPERFMRLLPDGRVETRPIKGTIARGRDAAADAAAKARLAGDAKERAENLMITDLLRNDLGKVCEIGSVCVPELFAVESYAQAHHLVSAVTGKLRAGLDAFDLLAATLPGGSITGAPKRRAMQVIDELEAGPRGAYCGVLAWIGFDGAMDSAVIIRTVTQTGDRLLAQAGGGITWDSVGEAEYAEAMLKISPLLALGR